MCLFENACKGIKSRAEKQKIFGPLKVKESQSSVSQGDKFFACKSTQKSTTLKFVFSEKKRADIKPARKMWCDYPGIESVII